MTIHGVLDYLRWLGVPARERPQAYWEKVVSKKGLPDTLPYYGGGNYKSWEVCRWRAHDAEGERGRAIAEAFFSVLKTSWFLVCLYALVHIVKYFWLH